ncbi:YCII-related domain protein [Myxozyma melibiosi]|uniref:YCII-related domain protein n=1 Tax=Myxozyma melibiosi TaxID=54550 RepID=A0ABR1F7H7_9ASCO
MSAQLYEYVVIIPDKDDAECVRCLLSQSRPALRSIPTNLCLQVNRRVAVRQEHLVGVKKLFADGVMTSGGAYLDGPITTESTPSFKGSVVTMLAESKEQVKEIMMKDVYSSNDVWDWEKAQIFNFACAVRKAKE